MASDKIKKRKKHPQVGEKISKIITYANQHNPKGTSHFKLLWQIIRENPGKGSLIASKMGIFKSYSLFLLFINNSHQLNTFSRLVPNTTEKIIHLLLSNSTIYEQIIKNNEDLYFTETNFKRHRDSLIKMAYSTTDAVQRYITDAYRLRQAARMFPNYFNLIIQSMALSTKKHNHFYDNIEDFCISIDTLTAYRKPLIDIAFNNIDEFNRIFISTADLHKVKKILQSPSIESILSSDTIDEARNQMKNRLIILSIKEIEKNINILVTLSKIITELPSALISMIASFTADSQVHSRKEAEEICFKYASTLKSRKITNVDTALTFAATSSEHQLSVAPS